MTTSRLELLSSLDDQELRIAIAREVMRLTNVRADKYGNIRGNEPALLTTVPIVIPNWLESDFHIRNLERILKLYGHFASYQREVAGAFGENPSRRQRCEAALLAVRNDG